MSDKFKDVPLEHDTTIITQQETKLGEYAVLHHTYPQIQLILTYSGYPRLRAWGIHDGQK